jgi:ATP-dependent helicase HrpA
VPGASAPAAPLLEVLERELLQMTGVAVPREAWQPDRLPDHLKITFRVLDERGRTLAEGKDLAALRLRLKPAVRAAVAQAADRIERDGLRSWSFGTLPRVVELTQAGHRVPGYPALVSGVDSVAVRVLDSEAEQQQAMWPGTRRLLLLSLPSPVRYVSERLTNEAKLALRSNPHGSVAALLEDCIGCAADKLIADFGGPVWDEGAFGSLLDAVRPELNGAVLEVVRTVERILRAARGVERRLADVGALPMLPAVSDVKAQLAGLVYPGFVTATGWRRLPDLPRYLAGIERRLEKLPDEPHRDRERMARVQQVQQAYQQALDRLPPGRPAGEALLQVRWMIEELRVSYFAQALRTPYPVSEQRIARVLTG